MQPWVFIDVSFIAHRARYSMRGLQFDDAPTGVIFGFFEQIKSICSDPRVLSTNVALCFDSRESFRKKAFPDYKARRHDNRTEEEKQEIIMMHGQLNRLRSEFLADVGFRVFLQNGLESDDLMAMGAWQLRNGIGDGAKGVMVTADQDLYQAINRNVCWFNPDRKAKDAYLDRDGFRALMGVPPRQWAEVKCLAGCRGDGVPGIPGIGEKTAVKWLKGKLPQTSKKYADIANDSNRVADRNRNLVTLPHEQTLPLLLNPPRYDADEFFRHCKRHGIDSYLEGAKKRFWQAFFRGNITSTVQVPRKRGERRE